MPNVGIAILNDDYTPMDFVIDVLEQHFRFSRDDATRTTLAIHEQGGAIVAKLVERNAIETVVAVNGRAASAGHPFTCKLANEFDEQRYPSTLQW